MNWKIIIKPINVGWLSLNSKATNSSFRPIKTANNEKHKKEFICRKKKNHLQFAHILFLSKLTFASVIEKKIPHLTDNNILDSMAKLPVTKLMTQHRQDLWVVAPLFLVLQIRLRAPLLNCTYTSSKRVTLNTSYCWTKTQKRLPIISQTLVTIK